MFGNQPINNNMSGNSNSFNNYNKNQYNPGKQTDNISTNFIKAQAKLIDAERDVRRAQLNDIITQNKKKGKRSLEQIIAERKRQYNINNLEPEKYPRDIHYSKLLNDEKKKPDDNKGVLYIQSNENSDINKIEKIEEKYSLENNLFIDAGLNIEELEEETSLESFQQEEEKDLTKTPLKQPGQSLDITYNTLKRSYKFSSIPEKYHTTMTVLNWSIQEYFDLTEVFEKFLENSDKIIEKEKVTNYILKSLIEDSSIRQYGGTKEIDNPKSKNEPIFYNKISKIKNYKDIRGFKKKLNEFYTVVKSLQRKTGNKKFPFEFDDKMIFFIFYDLLVNKSFWILIPDKNKSFILYLCNRMFELLDDSNEEVIHLITKAESSESVKNKGPKDVIKKIINKYYEDTSDEKINKIIDVIINLNSLKKDDSIAENFQLKIVTGSKYKNDNSWSSKWRSINENEKKRIFTLLSDIDHYVLTIILFGIGSKGFIQYLLVSSVYILHKNQKLHEMSTQLNDFGEFITEINNNDIFKRKNLKKISDDLKKQIAILTNDTDYIKTPYKSFLNYIWKEFNAIEDSKKKKKSVFKRAKDFAKKVDKQLVSDVHTKSKKKKKKKKGKE